MPDDRDEALERLLRLVPYFRDLDRVSLARLAGALEPIDVTAGTEITREGTEAHELYLVERGELSAAVHSPDGAKLNSWYAASPSIAPTDSRSC